MSRTEDDGDAGLVIIAISFIVGVGVSRILLGLHVNGNLANGVGILSGVLFLIGFFKLIVNR